MKSKKKGILSWIYLTLFVILIIAGITIKRVYGHPNLVIVFHLPAAVFLMLGGIEFRKRRAEDYEREVYEFKRRDSESSKIPL
jgi:hypothetical protein